MTAKQNGPYTDGNVDSLKHSGVQPWSAGEAFPYVVFQRDSHTPAGEFIKSEFVVTLAGEELSIMDSWKSAEDRAVLFKRHGVKTKYAAQWLEAEAQLLNYDTEDYTVSLVSLHDGRIADAVAVVFNQAMHDEMAAQDAERFAVSRREGKLRDEHDNRVLYGDAEHVPYNLSQVVAHQWEEKREREKCEEGRSNWNHLARVALGIIPDAQ